MHLYIRLDSGRFDRSFHRRLYCWQQSSQQRSITPDLAAFTALTPSSQFSQPLQPGRPTTSTTTHMPMRPAQQPTTSSIDWSAAAANKNPTSWSTQQPARNGASGSFGIPPPPTSPQGIGQSSYNFPSLQPPAQQQQSSLSGSQKSGLDKYDSLL